MFSRRTLFGGLGLVSASLAACAAYAFGIEPHLRLHIARYRLTPPGWPNGQRVRIVAISDIHASVPWMQEQRIAAIAARANALQPDVIVLLGDYEGAHCHAIDPLRPARVMAALAGLAAPIGVFAILGNHDYWGQPHEFGRDNADRWREAFAAIGIPVLDNRAVRLSGPDGRPFWLAGTA